jgi:hypothetical protein
MESRLFELPSEHPCGAASIRAEHNERREHWDRVRAQLRLDARIKRGRVATDAFKRSHPCPATGKSRGACPGYVIEHVIALKRGGSDAPGNMQWQTVQAAKAKDKVE